MAETDQAMTTEATKAEVDRFIDAWAAAIADPDTAAAARLRSADYRVRLPDGTWLGCDEELALMRSGAFRPNRHAVEDRAISVGAGDLATSVAFTVTGVFGDGAATAEARFRCFLDLARKNGTWTARAARIENAAPANATSFDKPRKWRLLGLLPNPVRRWLRDLKRRREARSGFQNSAFIPYRNGESFLLPPPTRRDAKDSLPIPPESLWLGYNYPAHGRLHVDTMLRSVEESGLELRPGDRILDLGCGAGRMIRHLEPLARTCEIWGTDISAEHILWCKQNLSPPFNFATTTKVPSLPFEDRSFALVYCGSLFTHIDDLADAWLLELHRILAPEGRLYLTIHDQHTMKLLDEPHYGWSAIVREMKADPLFTQARSGFGMFAIGRDDRSQVFYEREFFHTMTDRMFETLATIEEAYFYQTALVLKRRTRA